MSKRDHFSKLTITTERSNLPLAQGVGGQYNEMSREMLINELEIGKQQQKLMQLKAEKLMMEKQDLMRKNEYCLREHSKLYEASRLIDRSDCFPNKEEVKKEIDAILRKLQNLELENLDLRNQLEGRRHHGKNSSDPQNLNIIDFIVKLELIRLNTVKDHLLEQLQDKDVVIEELSNSIENLRTEFQAELVGCQKQLDAMQKTIGIQKSQLEASQQQSQAQNPPASIVPPLKDLATQINCMATDRSSSNQNGSKLDINFSNREVGNTMQSSLLLTLIRQLYQKIEQQAVMVYKSLKNSSKSALKIINIAPHLNYAITQGLSTLDYENFIQVHELALKCLTHVSALHQQRGNHEESELANSIQSGFNHDDYYSQENPEFVNYASEDQRHKNESSNPLSQHRNLMQMGSSTFDQSQKQDPKNFNNGNPKQFFDEDQTFFSRTHPSVFQDSSLDQQNRGNQNTIEFDDGNIKIHDEEYHHQTNLPSEKASTIKPSIDEGMIISEIITADKIMDQNSHSNQKDKKDVQNYNKFDVTQTQPFSNLGFSDRTPYQRNITFRDQ